MVWPRPREAPFFTTACARAPTADDDPLPSFGKRQALAQTLNMTPRSVQIWFQNRRQRDPNRVRKPQHKPVLGRLVRPSHPP